MGQDPSGVSKCLVARGNCVKRYVDALTHGEPGWKPSSGGVSRLTRGAGTMVSSMREGSDMICVAERDVVSSLETTASCLVDVVGVEGEDMRKADWGTARMALFHKSSCRIALVRRPWCRL